MTFPRHNRFLLLGATGSAAAGVLHLGCLVFGAPWYRALGAGERIARMAEAGHPRPAVMTVFIAAVLFVWALYALSGAGVIRRLPLLRTVLCAVTAVYLLRGTLFVLLMPYFPDNGPLFWAVSSGICLALGLVHLAGLRQAWSRP